MSVKDDAGRESQRQYYLLTVEIKDYVMIYGRDFFDWPIKSDLKTYDNIKKIATGQGDDYTTVCLLGGPYFKKIQQFNCNRFKQLTKIRCWSKSNTANQFYWRLR